MPAEGGTSERTAPVRGIPPGSTPNPACGEPVPAEGGTSERTAPFRGSPPGSTPNPACGESMPAEGTSERKTLVRGSRPVDVNCSQSTSNPLKAQPVRDGPTAYGSGRTARVPPGSVKSDDWRKMSGRGELAYVFLTSFSLLAIFWQTLRGPSSAISKPIFASKLSF